MVGTGTGRRLWRAGAWIAVALALGAPVAAAELGRDAMLGFLAQCLYTAENGQPILPSPERPPCRADQLQTLASPARWRKHDYGTRGMLQVQAEGHQVSDSVIDPRRDRDGVIQTFDFGDAPRRFHAFDKGNGDGGDYIALVDGGAYGVLTEDGGNGLQFFVGEACRSGDLDGRLKSWLMFRSDVTAGAWTEAVARLTIARSAGDCPAGFASAYTRYARASLAVPFRITDRDGRTSRRSTTIDTIVSEHFGGESIEGANALERFYFGRDLGKYRWEAWQNRNRSREPGLQAKADEMVRSGRCAPLPFSSPPAEGYVMVDCRMWTNLVWEKRPWAAREFGWPEVDPFGGR